MAFLSRKVIFWIAYPAKNEQLPFDLPGYMLGIGIIIADVRRQYARTS